MRHVSQYQQHLARSISAVLIRSQAAKETNTDKTERYTEILHGGNLPLVGACTGASSSAPSINWPPELYAALSSSMILVLRDS